MTEQDWRDCYWHDKGLNRQRITRRLTRGACSRAYISEALETIQYQVAANRIDGWVQGQIRAEIERDWIEYQENQKPCLFEMERAWDEHQEPLWYEPGFLGCDY